ncbi:DNA translocase FtsK [Sesbania bispinosa]|nr:DNA translocase FtsK [Sesbania bispinosa]
MLHPDVACVAKLSLQAPLLSPHSHTSPTNRKGEKGKEREMGKAADLWPRLGGWGRDRISPARAAPLAAEVANLTETRRCVVGGGEELLAQAADLAPTVPDIAGRGGAPARRAVLVLTQKASAGARRRDHLPS